VAFSSEEFATYESILDAFIERNRPRREIRDQVDLSYRVERQSVVIFEIRPAMFRPGETIEGAVAKPSHRRTAVRRWERGSRVTAEVVRRRGPLRTPFGFLAE